MISNSRAELHELVNKLDNNLLQQATLKVEKQTIETKIAELIDPALIMQSKGKEHGETSVEIDGIKFVVGADKKIKWDSKKLQEIASGLPWARVVSLFKITFEIPEVNYKNLQNNVAGGLEPAELLDRVNDARTVTVDESKVKKASIIEE